jgi:soluble lytic murein transglycosylase
MTPSTTTTRSRSGRVGRSAPRPAGPASRVSARGSRTRRRRRWVTGLLALAALAAIVVATMPLAKRAVNDFGLPLRYSATIRRQAAAEHLDPALIAGVIYAETKFDPRTSPTGAEGLMQVEPQTALDLAKRSGATAFSVADLQHPATNIAYGSYYLRELLNLYHGSKVLALAAVIGGETNVDRWEAAARASGHTLQISQIPFPETRAYVAKVLGAERRYRRVYPRQLGYG